MIYSIFLEYSTKLSASDECNISKQLILIYVFIVILFIWEIEEGDEVRMFPNTIERRYCKHIFDFNSVCTKQNAKIRCTNCENGDFMVYTLADCC